MYIGNSVHNKQSTISFKNKKKVRKPKDKWLTVEGTHEPIISMKLWELTHAHIDSRKRPVKKWRNTNFCGTSEVCRLRLGASIYAQQRNR